MALKNIKTRVSAVKKVVLKKAKTAINKATKSAKISLKSKSTTASNGKSKSIVSKSAIKKADTSKLIKKTKTPAPVKTIRKIEEEHKIKKSPAVKPVLKTETPVNYTQPANLAPTKVKSILVSQPKPESEKNPYSELSKKMSVRMDFRPFIQIDGLSAIDFRLQRVNILDHNAVILTSRSAVNHFFRMCNEMRITVPETMKYFCLSESTAYYLQNYVQYRKRKIFFGHQTISDLVEVIKKHREDNFLLPVSDIHKEQIVDLLDNLGVKYTKAIFYKTVSSNIKDIDVSAQYDILVFFAPAGIKSLLQNFPKFKQGNIRIAAFGPTTAQAIKEAGLRLDIYAPTQQAPSMTMALEQYMKEANKR
jgi:uroporphyrinogen-III synthase